ncbi:hypothetical protein [Paenibacillus darwinianus]|uniref:hypothetical protein n=1 Tax=Paenibacillus darwinianus TaxID=1380763 RepID=UPI00044DB763|nr:hypothetical protein [Paenibacillus darwinianus]EXX84780.1 hypothetical protein CH50_10855 [Paenibacillus darwinianus]EXX86096.1 hypothetical protein BG52_07075 [Paenibacillus darwinianus]
MKTENTIVGSIGEADVSAWIEAALPKARERIAPGFPFHGDDLQVHLSFAEPHAVPLGRWMGCYPELVDGKGQLIALRDWTFYLVFLRKALEPLAADGGMLNRAFADRSRIKIGIMNDVYQPFAPLPEIYSMIRHHSLILYLSFDWLESHEREQWETICGWAGKSVAERLLAHPEPIRAIEEAEERGRSMMLQTASLSCSDEGMQNLLADNEVSKAVTPYLLLTCFGIDVLIKKSRRFGDRDAWLNEEILLLSEPDYLEKDILHFVQAAGT